MKGGLQLVRQHPSGNLWARCIASRPYLTLLPHQRPPIKVRCRAYGSSTLESTREGSCSSPSHSVVLPEGGVVEAKTGTLPVVILPGLFNSTADYNCPDGMAGALRRRGFSVYVTAVERMDWLRIGPALLSLDYWQQQCTTHYYRWYLDRVRCAVETALQQCGTDQVHLVGHSAGGWLGRAVLAELLGPGMKESSPIASLVTLGTPHVPPCHSASRDMTGGALTWVNTQWPGAHFAAAGVRYVCVAGRAVQADAHAPVGSVQHFAHISYTQVCGEGHGHFGDSIVPVAHAHLEGAENIVLEGVLHKMASNGSASADHKWYGSEAVIDQWLSHLVQ